MITPGNQTWQEKSCNFSDDFTRSLDVNKEFHVAMFDDTGGQDPKYPLVLHTHTHTHIYIYIYIFIYLFTRNEYDNFSIYIYTYIFPWDILSIGNYRRKFRRQTSDNMDRWKAEMGRVREKRRVEERRSERKNRKKEDAGARKGRQVAKHCFSNNLWLRRVEK